MSVMAAREAPVRGGAAARAGRAPLGGVRIGIAGAGIGGLTAAAALRARGADVVVYERAAQPRGGVALLIWANAMAELAALGIADELAAVASPIDATEVRTPAGELLCALPIGAWRPRPDWPTVAIRRAALLAALWRVAGGPEGAVRVGAVRGFSARGEQVAVELADGAADVVDALIGADGLTSVVRAALLGEQPPRALGQRAWVGISSRALLTPGVATATVGRGPRFWMAPLPDGTFWYATVPDPPGPPLVEPELGARARLRAALAGWHAPIAELLEQTAEAAITATAIRDRPPAARWGAGAVTLLGDAAHPSSPDLGQGACQAIESAAVLARCLERAVARAEPVSAGLRAYERARMERTATITRLCWLTAVNSTIASPLWCGLRDRAMRVGLAPVARSHLAWILAGPAC